MFQHLFRCFENINIFVCFEIYLCVALVGHHKYELSLCIRLCVTFILKGQSSVVVISDVLFM